LGLTSGDTVGGFATPTGSPLSNNSTFQDNATKKFIYVDLAYAKWYPINNANWNATFTVGKMENPFVVPAYVFDPDYTPEGAAAQVAYAINDRNSLKLTGSWFVLDELAASSHDPFMLGGQLVWDSTWSKKVTTSIGVSAFTIDNTGNLNNANVPNVNRGNTRATCGQVGAFINKAEQFTRNGKLSEADRRQARLQQRNDSWNVRQALITVGSGGFTGKGWRQGQQISLGYLPPLVSHNDFIFSVIAEEKGFLGSLSVLSLYTVILFAGIRTAGRARDRLGKLLAVGVVALLFSHVFINIGMNIRLMPVTGIPLPLLSYGGTSVLCSLVAAGILQNIHIYRRS
jgi:hypothetical protein